jgi:DNA-directed RNA polymerase subunit RPC12/RpoP
MPNCTKHGPYYPDHPGCPECGRDNEAHLIAENERLRKRVALCPHCSGKLAEQALENPPLHGEG